MFIMWNKTHMLRNKSLWDGENEKDKCMIFSATSDKGAANMWDTIHCFLYQWNSKYDDIQNILKYVLATCHMVSKLVKLCKYVAGCQPTFLNRGHAF